MTNIRTGIEEALQILDKNNEIPTNMSNLQNLFIIHRKIALVGTVTSEGNTINPGRTSSFLNELEYHNA